LNCKSIGKRKKRKKKKKNEDENENEYENEKFNSKTETETETEAEYNIKQNSSIQSHTSVVVSLVETKLDFAHFGMDKMD
jgi:hypothetical protein